MNSSNGFKGASPLGISPKATPFYLVQERDNRYKYDERCERSIDFSNMIPFLRGHEDSRSVQGLRVARARSMNNTWSFQRSGRKIMANKNREEPEKEALTKKEGGFDLRIKPISQINERLHPSQKTRFEMI